MSPLALPWAVIPRQLGTRDVALDAPPMATTDIADPLGSFTNPTGMRVARGGSEAVGRVADGKVGEEGIVGDLRCGVE